MITVNISTARNHLSKLIAQVIDGETVIIQDRDKSVVQITRIAEETKYERLVREGKIIPAKDPNAARMSPLKVGDPNRSLSQTVINMREED